MVRGHSSLVIRAAERPYDLAGGADPLGEVGGIVWRCTLLGFGVLTVKESEERSLRVLGVVTAVGGLMFLVATAGAAVA